ncbi:ankyrin repeat-containing domain protein, partial [Syncephalis fuscata]
MQHGIIPLRNLGLHQGAATGNVGLVKFALELGQPVNSVLNGVLPIHVACCSNSVQTVQMLLDHGADVNARRYPRKYSGDRVILPAKVNANGSTALHFAAANGN